MQNALIFTVGFFLIALVFYLFPPKKINRFYGFRTSLSIQSNEHWHFANKLASVLFLIFAVFNFVLYFVFTYLNQDFNGLIKLLIILEALAIYFYVNHRLKKFKNVNESH
jgi:uncharacterized membrane protein